MMVCRFTYKGKDYSQDQLAKALRDMNPDEASKYIPSVQSMPTPPFEKTWPDLALKRMLHRAATEKNPDGSYKYNSMSWTPGAEQNRRYPGRPDKEQKGMENFYDEMLPNKVNSLLKKYGSKVQYNKEIPGGLDKSMVSGEVVMNHAGIPQNQQHSYWRNLSQQQRDKMFKDYRNRQNKINVHVVPITPELRKSAEKGFPTFARGGRVKIEKKNGSYYAIID